MYQPTSFPPPPAHSALGGLDRSIGPMQAMAHLRRPHMDRREFPRPPGDWALVLGSSWREGEGCWRSWRCCCLERSAAPP